MSEVAYLRWGEAKATTKEVDSTPFGEKLRRRLMFDAVVMYEANRRVGTAAVKGRSSVRGTSKKPFRQKGTGRARVGSLQSPTRMGGGVSMGPQPRDYSYSMPKKQRRLALASAVLSKLQDGEVALVDKFDLAAPKTKEIASFVGKLPLDGSKLLVTAAADSNLYMSARNIQGLAVCSEADLNAWDVLRYRNLIITEEAFEQLGERMKNAGN